MKFIFILIFITLIYIPNITLAASLSDAFLGDNSPLETVAGSKGAGYDTSQNFNSLFGVIVQTLLSLLGVFFLSLMIYGGFLWMTDRGNSDQVEKAKKLITAAVIGMVIVLASYAISFFVLKAISTSTLK